MKGNRYNVTDDIGKHKRQNKPMTHQACKSKHRQNQFKNIAISPSENNVYLGNLSWFKKRI